MKRRLQREIVRLSISHGSLSYRILMVMPLPFFMSVLTACLALLPVLTEVMQHGCLAVTTASTTTDTALVDIPLL